MADEAASHPPQAAAEDCHLLALPPELLNYIYELTLLNEEQAIDADFEVTTYAKADLTQPPLTRVNREHRQVTLPIFYGQNSFRLGLNFCGQQAFDRWMHGIGDRAHLLRRVELSMCDTHGIFVLLETPAGQPATVRIVGRNPEGKIGEQCFLNARLSRRIRTERMRATLEGAETMGLGPRDYIAVVRRLMRGTAHA
ncbi:hypothetical protein LTR08_002989 [Meristemomyces frigidus]|nr:hypothetical protein LTR08_002989 [Meristemomyces frigidus]